MTYKEKQVVVKSNYYMHRPPPQKPCWIHWRIPDGRKGIYEGRVNVDASGDPNWFWWEEGNAACDCNRSMFFLNEEWPCGDKIKVLKMELVR